MSTKSPFDDIDPTLKPKINVEDMSPREFEIYSKSILKEKYKEYNKEKGYTKREYADKELGEESIINILDNDIFFQEAIIQAAIKLGKDEEYAKKVWNNPYRYIPELLDDFNDNKTLKQIKTKTNTTKTILKQNETLLQLIRMLSRDKILLNLILDHEKRISQLEEKDELTQARVDLQEQKIKALNKEVGLKNNLTKNDVIPLLDKGYTIKAVARAVGVSESTVKRIKRERSTIEDISE